jgi:transposase
MYPLDACALPGRGIPGWDGEDRMFAGVDTHKDTLAVAMIDHAGRVVRQLELPNQDSGYARLLALLSSHNVVRVGVEGSGNFGWPAAIYLLERDLNVVEVPPLMTSRERLSRPGRARPTRSTRSRSPASPPARMPCRRSVR